MASNLDGFDPILYLGLHLDPQVKQAVSEKLLDFLSQYLTIRTVELLPQDKLEEINSPEELFLTAQKVIPDFNRKIKIFLQDFLKEYQKEVGII